MQSNVGPTHYQNSSTTPGRVVVALALALLTGLTLGQMNLPIGETIEPSSSQSSSASQTGKEFYDAIDSYLTNGDASKLRTLVQPDFIDHTAGDPTAPGIEASLRHLDAMRSFDAGTRLKAIWVSASGDLARFAISIAPRPIDHALGAPINESTFSEGSETLRVTDGRVAERWSDRQSAVPVTSISSIAWDPPAASQTLPAIERVTMLSGSKLTLKIGTTHVIVVEKGALTIEGTAPGADDSNTEVASGATGSWPMVARAGSTVVTTNNSPYRITNEGSGAASALLIRLAGFVLPGDDPVIDAIGTSQNDVGVQIETLSAAIELPQHMGVWTVEIGRVMLPPGTIIPPHEVNGSELVYVERGALETDFGNCGNRCIQTIDGIGAFANDRRLCHAEHGLSASDGATIAYRVAGSTSASLLIVSLIPEDR